MPTSGCQHPWCLHRQCCWTHCGLAAHDCPKTFWRSHDAFWFLSFSFLRKLIILLDRPVLAKNSSGKGWRHQHSKAILLFCQSYKKLQFFESWYLNFFFYIFLCGTIMILIMFLRITLHIKEIIEPWLYWHRRKLPFKILNFAKFCHKNWQILP